MAPAIVPRRDPGAIRIFFFLLPIRLDQTAYCANNFVDDGRNTVQHIAVNLAYAEPCPDQNPGTALFICWTVFARSARGSQGKAGYPQISQKDADFGNSNLRNRRNLRISFAFGAPHRLRTVK